MYSNKEKQLAWNYFAKYIKARDSLDTTGELEHCRCVSCGAYGETRHMDAGHLVPGRSNGVLFDEEGVYAQCQDCNRAQSGNLKNYRAVLVDRLGEDKVLEIEARKHLLVKHDFQEVINCYKMKLKKLKNPGSMQSYLQQ